MLLLGSPDSASEQSLPLQPFSVRYQVLVEGKAQGETTLSLEPEDDDWRFRMRAKGTSGLARIANADVDQWVRFTRSGDALQPLSARTETNTVFGHRRIDTIFDSAHREIRWEGDLNDDRRGPLQLNSGATNSTLLNLQLGLALAAAPSPGAELRFELCEKGRCDPAVWTVLESERVETSLGGVEARRVRREQPNKQRTTTAWYPLQGPPTPLRLYQTEKGEPKYELRQLPDMR